MKIFGIVVLAVVAAFGMMTWGKYNTFVSLDEGVRQSYADIQNVLQRQAELIPNLVEVTKAYATHERETFEKVAEARSKAAGVINLDPSKVANDPALQKQLAESAAAMSSSLGRLLVSMEKYPELKAITLFSNLTAELAGSINRVTRARNLNQRAVREYNQNVRQFPGSVIASLTGFQQKPYFEADAGSQTQPKVKF